MSHVNEFSSLNLEGAESTAKLGHWLRVASDEFVAKVMITPNDFLTITGLPISEIRKIGDNWPAPLSGRETFAVFVFLDYLMEYRERHAEDCDHELLVQPMQDIAIMKSSLRSALCKFRELG